MGHNFIVSEMLLRVDRDTDNTHDESPRRQVLISNDNGCNRKINLFRIKVFNCALARQFFRQEALSIDLDDSKSELAIISLQKLFKQVKIINRCFKAELVVQHTVYKTSNPN